MMDVIRTVLIAILGIGLCLFTLLESNFAYLAPLTQLALFALLGLLICFLAFPLLQRWEHRPAARWADVVLSLAAVGCFGYLIWQGNELTNQRVGQYTATDHAVAIVGMLLVAEATRRSIGATLPILAMLFVLYALCGPSLPNWLFPHRGYDLSRIAAQCFLGSEGIFGIAMRVMFTYVFLFVLFGVFLEVSGAAQYIIDFAQRVFSGSPGGAAKVSVLSSGLMGSLSGSAVANAATTGAFTIPMMRSAGFSPTTAAAIEAAASSGGALVPPVMGAGAYMMLEIIDPPVEFLDIVKAALLPAILYYFSILMMVHLYARRIGVQAAARAPQGKGPSLWQYEGLIFFGSLAALVGFLVAGCTPFRAVTYSLELILVLIMLRPRAPLRAWDRAAALAAFAGITIAVGLLRARSDAAASWLDAPAWRRFVGLAAHALQAEQDLSLSDPGLWLDAAIHAMLASLLLGMLHRRWRPIVGEALVKAAKAAVPLVSASACVGIVIGVVYLTGVGAAFPNAVVPLAQESLLMALLAIMVCSIVLGMGLPSAVCYLLMATLIGPVLNRLGVVPLAAHLFIFYFGMMSMVTPPVALAAYATASIAKSDIMSTSLAAFRFALAGFTLPFIFVYRPELLLLSDKPNVEVSVVRVEQGQTVANVHLTRNRLAVSHVRVMLGEIGQAEPRGTDRTDLTGNVRASLTPGTWRLAMLKKRKRIVHVSPGDGSPLEQGEWLEDDKGRRMAWEEARPPGDGGPYYAVSDGRELHLGTVQVAASAGPDSLRFVDQRLSVAEVLLALAAAVVGIVALAAGIAGQFRTRLSLGRRALMLLAAALLLAPEVRWGMRDFGPPVNGAGAVLFLALAVADWRRRPADEIQPRG